MVTCSICNYVSAVHKVFLCTPGETISTMVAANGDQKCNLYN